MSAFKNKLKIEKFEDYIFFLFLILYTSFLLFISNRMVIGEDEAYTLSTTSFSLLKVIKLSYSFEGQPPVYFVIISIWRLINNSLFFARILSLLFTLLSAFVLDKLVYLISRKIYSRWIIVLFLLNPFTVWASIEVRLYSMLILISTTTIYLFYLIYFHDHKKYKFFFFLVALLGIYTQYYFVFLIISLSILLLLAKGWRHFFNFCLFAIPLAILFLPNLSFIKDQFEMHNNTQISHTLFQTSRAIFSTPFYFFVSSGDLANGRNWAWIMRIIFIILFVFSVYQFQRAYKNKKNQDFIKIIGILVPTVIILVIMLLVYGFSNLIYDYKYMTIVFPIYCLLYGIFNILDHNLKNYIYGFFCFFFIVVLINTYKSPYIKIVDFKSIVEFTQRTEYENEPILFHCKTIVLKFKYYYKGNNSLNPLPPLKFDYNYYNDDLKDTIELDQSIKNVYKNSKTVLLITGNDMGFTKKMELTNEMINRYINNNYIVQIDTTFKGKIIDDNIRVRRLFDKRITKHNNKQDF